jgi:hypothetical protein
LRFTLDTCEAAGERCRPMGWTTLSGQPTIGPLPANYPLYFIKTDKSVMTDHNDIFNQKVRSFVFTVIDDVVRRALVGGVKAARGEGEPPLIASPDRFAARMNALWGQMGSGAR